MIGRDCPFHEAKIAGGTGRVRDFLTTSPAIRGNASVAVEMHVLPASAWPFMTAISAVATATVIAVRIRFFRT
jgi:hypothetical protein